MAKNRKSRNIISFMVTLVIVVLFVFTPLGSTLLDWISIAFKYLSIAFDWLAGALRWITGLFGIK